ncbi:NADPH-dependent ferric siderophore reductase, contains FAD-binding and SIP domains [Paraoerskovia marina]|uniref:NADPH-dependent ferric siderophore reductase, contains FAD-binding and SIP domains n=1 Tax=Paraoerskovia marina TaxID=545619 RepID=A0A1H1RQB6_9CELL|nr:siderophore-interacting protein [Paraoerskovia marina]SDS37925.1 NADPH-dependent ferric siderophore reductase, contains FAD-binding and SIP domains [Paraoerskovia marina]
MGRARATKPVDPQVLIVEVVRTARISPSIVRVTLGGDGLGQLTALGRDQWFRLFLPREGQDSLRLPTRTSALWYAQYLTTPKAQRPHVRAYTVRAARPEERELDVDFVVHVDADGTSGPAATFALTAAPGDQVGILDQGISYYPEHEHDWTLVVADETGLPAVAGICASLPEDARGLVLAEIPTAADAQEFPVPPGVELRWVVRDEAGHQADDGVPGRAVLAALHAAELPAGTVYAYTCGESALATGARRHLVTERGVPKNHVDFVGYWRHGHAAA